MYVMISIITFRSICSTCNISNKDPILSADAYEDIIYAQRSAFDNRTVVRSLSYRIGYRFILLDKIYGRSQYSGQYAGRDVGLCAITRLLISTHRVSRVTGSRQNRMLVVPMHSLCYPAIVTQVDLYLREQRHDNCDRDLQHQRSSRLSIRVYTQPNNVPNYVFTILQKPCKMYQLVA